MQWQHLNTVSTGRRTLLGEKKLVDDNVVRINLILRQFLDKSFRLVKRQELGYTDTDKSRLLLNAVSGPIQLEWTVYVQGP